MKWQRSGRKPKELLCSNCQTFYNQSYGSTFITLKCNGFGNMNYYLRLLIYKYKLTSLFIIMAKAISILKSIKRQ